MPPTPIFPLVDRILGGKLTEWLRSQRAEGLSYERIAANLTHAHDIEVTSETVRKWCRAEGIDPAPAEAAS